MVGPPPGSQATLGRTHQHRNDHTRRSTTSLPERRARNTVSGSTTNSRTKIHRRIAQILRGRARSSIAPADIFPHFIDVTDTWRDSHKRDQLSKKEFDLLWTAVSHFSKGNRPTLSAEAAVTLVERLFDTSGGHSYLAGTAGRRSDRERRHRIYAVLTEARIKSTAR